MAKHKIEAIPIDAKVNIVIPGSFYARLQQLTVHYSQSKPYEELVKAMEELKENKPTDSEFAYHVQTLTILMFEIEKAAKDQGVSKLEEIDIPEAPSES